MNDIAAPLTEELFDYVEELPNGDLVFHSLPTPSPTYNRRLKVTLTLWAEADDDRHLSMKVADALEQAICAPGFRNGEHTNGRESAFECEGTIVSLRHEFENQHYYDGVFEHRD